MNDGKETTSAGVEALVARLRDEGVMAARQERERILHEAQTQATRIVAEAETAAEQARARAERDIAAEREAALAALRLAARDASQSLQQALTDALHAHVQRILREEMGNPSFLRELVLAIATTASHGFGDAERPRRLALGTGLVAGNDPEAAAEIRRMLLALSKDMLAQGVELIEDPELPAGARMRIENGQGTLELTDVALAGLLRKHLAPRFRSILEGDA